MDFQPIVPEHRELLLKYQQQTPRDGLNYLWEVMFLYRNVCEFELCEWNGFLFIKTFVQCTHNFLYPLGQGDIGPAIAVMRDYSERHRCPFALFQIREEELQEIRSLDLQGLRLTQTPEEEEYVYLREKLATLQGKHLQSKRNHINALLKECDFLFEPFDLTNVQEAQEFEEAWSELYFDSSDLQMEIEKGAVREAFNHWQELDMKGGVIRINGKVEGFSIGTELNGDTFVVLFEKANPDIRGVYPLLNREFVCAFGERYTYINREEDNGDEGLRKAKESYQPLVRRPLWSLMIE